MQQDFRKVLAAMPRRVDGLVFLGFRGGRLRDRIVLHSLKTHVIGPLKKEFKTPAGEIGFAHGTIHGLRHFFCSEAYRNGATDTELLEWLGHRDSALLKLYRRLRREDSHRKMDSITFFDRDGEEGQKGGVA